MKRQRLIIGSARRGGRTLSGLLLPVCCAACGQPGAALCPACRRQAVLPAPFMRTLSDGLLVRAATRYEGVVRACVLECKRTGSEQLQSVLAELAASCLQLQLAADCSTEPLTVIPVHSGKQTRGRAGTDLGAALARRAAAITRRRTRHPVRVVDLLEVVRRAMSQKSLDRRERQNNVAGSMRARSRRRPNPRRIVLFDDVVTTGSTLMEARRALAEAGYVITAAITIASA